MKPKGVTTQMKALREYFLKPGFHMIVTIAAIAAIAAIAEKCAQRS